ncbi:MAG: hypothetical protein DRP14_01795 [Candidatus Aenigmatarchaeota archaeon]|nr:MAG: hypothetical protein DRG73_05815 [Deltaproteobacteria bacterium]RLJ05480.1 MAG: hypothetical protein DRP14_01795 [Candidatus Aenigmarchaeota archaeon]
MAGRRPTTDNFHFLLSVFISQCKIAFIFHSDFTQANGINRPSGLTKCDVEITFHKNERKKEE